MHKEQGAESGERRAESGEWRAEGGERRAESGKTILERTSIAILVHRNREYGGTAPRYPTSSLLLSGSAVQVGRMPSHTGIAGNELTDAAAKFAAEGAPSDDFPWSYSHLSS